MALTENSLRNRLSGTRLDSYISIYLVILVQKKFTVGGKDKYIYIKSLGSKIVSISKVDCINLQDVFVVFMWNCSEKYKPSSWTENSRLTF